MATSSRGSAQSGAASRGIALAGVGPPITQANTSLGIGVSTLANSVISAIGRTGARNTTVNSILASLRLN